MPRRKTHEEYVKEVAEINPDIEVVDRYINDNTKIKHRCKRDGYEWYAKPTIAKWLKTATSFGWCNYIPKNKTRTIYCVELNKIFNSIKSASDELGIWETSIINCLRGRWKYTIVPNTKEKLHWLYIEDMINI